jgi:hypothetical protein
MNETPETTALDVHVLVRRYEDGETDIMNVSASQDALAAETAELEAEQATTISPASFETRTYTIQVPALPEGWSAADLHALVITAGEIASAYGTGTDGLDRDDVLSTQQRKILAHARRDYNQEMAG